MLTPIQRPNSEGTYLGRNGEAKDAKLKRISIQGRAEFFEGLFHNLPSYMFLPTNHVAFSSEFSNAWRLVRLVTN